MTERLNFMSIFMRQGFLKVVTQDFYIFHNFEMEIDVHKHFLSIFYLEH